MRRYTSFLLVALLAAACSPGPEPEASEAAAATAEPRTETDGDGGGPADEEPEVADEPETEAEPETEEEPEPDPTPEVHPVPDRDAELPPGRWGVDLGTVQFDLELSRATNLFYNGRWEPDDYIVLQDAVAHDQFVELFVVKHVFPSETQRYTTVRVPRDLHRWVLEGNHAAFEFDDVAEHSHPDYDAFTFTARSVPDNIFKDLGEDPTFLSPHHDPEAEEGGWYRFAHFDGADYRYAGVDIDGTWVAIVTREPDVSGDFLHDILDDLAAPS